MKHVAFAFFSLFLVATTAGAADRPSTFHRILLLDDADQILLIKIKDYDVWVTPGWYQNQDQTVREGLAGLMAGYGVAMTPPELRGVFTLSHQDKQDMSTRLFHVSRMTGGELTLPDIISEAKWLPLDEAVALFSFEHIAVLTRQVLEHPGTVWGGSMMRQGEGFGQQAAIVDAFYPLFGKD